MNIIVMIQGNDCLSFLHKKFVVRSLAHRQTFKSPHHGLSQDLQVRLPLLGTFSPRPGSPDVLHSHICVRPGRTRGRESSGWWVSSAWSRHHELLWKLCSTELDAVIKSAVL
jgi:hypothetical protein